MYDQIAWSLKLIVLLSPFIEKDDYLLFQAINAFSPRGWNSIQEHEFPAIIERLMIILPEKAHEEFSDKARLQLEIWLKFLRQSYADSCIRYILLGYSQHRYK